MAAPRNQPSHVCHVITSLATGGAEQYVVQLANELNRLGMRASIVAGEPYLLRDRLDPSVYVHPVEMHPGSERSLLTYLRLLPKAIRELTAYFRRENVSVVHTHLSASAFPAWVAAKMCGVPVVHSKMYTAKHHAKGEKLIFGSRAPLLLVDRFLAFTRYTVDEIHTHWHVPASRIAQSSIGVDTDRFGPNAVPRPEARAHFGVAPTDKVLLVVARLHPEKDIELAIRAARALDDPNVILLIAGNGPQLAELETLVAQLAGRTRVRFVGLLRDPRPAYAAADLFLQTTRGPNLGVVVLEAMASGLPVLIAYRDDEERKMAVDTFDGQDIGAIAQATPETMAVEIRNILSDHEKLAAWQQSARHYVEQSHAQSQVFRQMAALYNAVENRLP